MSQNEVPYGIAGRLMPDSTSIDRLLPSRVGAFAREPIQPAGKGMPIYGNYRRGSATVFMELGICDDANEARAALETAAGESGATDQIVAGRDVSYWRSVIDNGAFMAWTRGRYYFSAHAAGGEKDLDEFMQTFPF